MCGDLRGMTALHLAAATGQINVLFSLLELQPDLALKTDKHDYLPTHYAAFYGQEGALELLLGHCKVWISMWTSFRV